MIIFGVLEGIHERAIVFTIKGLFPPMRIVPAWRALPSSASADSIGRLEHQFMTVFKRKKGKKIN
jgi:hypothetical protein